MNSPVLAAAARYVAPLIAFVSLVLLWKGHNAPGGGFIAGLTAAVAVLLGDFGRAAAEHRAGRLPGHIVRRLDRTDRLMALGIVICAVSAAAGPVAGRPPLTGLWLPEFTLPALGSVHLGTPLLFDIGVYATVVGFVVHAARALDWDPPEDGSDPEAIPWK